MRPKKLLFKKEMIRKILLGEKTQTRRLLTSKRIYKVGSIQPIQESYKKKARYHIKILGTFVQRLCNVTEAEVRAEGFERWVDFMGYLDKIHKESFPASEKVRAYVFELIWHQARKKPVIVGYREPSGFDIGPVSSMLGIKRNGTPVRPGSEESVEVIVQGQVQGEWVNTHEGRLFAVCGLDLIIRGVQGELYPIKKEIFARTYDDLEET